MKKIFLVVLIFACLASFVVPASAASDIGSTLVPGVEIAYFSNAQVYNTGETVTWFTYEPGAVPPTRPGYPLAPFGYYYLNSTPFRADENGYIPQGLVFGTNSELFRVEHVIDNGQFWGYQLINVKTGGLYDPNRYRAFSVFFAEGDAEGLWQDGYAKGYRDGYAQGSELTENIARAEGYEEGFADGRDKGYQEGLEVTEKGDWHSLIVAVVEVPFNTFQSLFSFEVLGLDMRVAFGAILSLCMILILVKFVM